jgi:hypothetical protein
MDTDKLRAWIYARQGLERCPHATARETLVHTGWQRSVGGVNPYLALRARSGEGRVELDALAQKRELYELPSARGCTYVLPADHFALGLTIGRSCIATPNLAMARKLDVTAAEIDALKTGVIAALADGALAPADLKTALGDKVRNLGEEGKRRGLTTTLPLALILLQSEGRIRRKPVNGRFDTQRYTYENWEPPLTDSPHEDDAATECARLFFAWIGAGTLTDFREFTAFGARAAQAALTRAGITRFAEDAELLSLPGADREFAAYEPPHKPAYSLVGNLDSYLLLTRSSRLWLHDADHAQVIPTDKGLRPLSELPDPGAHVILDRGRLIGVWEFDADQGRIAWATWTKPDEVLRAEIETAERYIRNDLEDARSFSLDSPASRQPRIEALCALHKTLNA